tara:strand:- start:264 stop:485 length:222 start_codon:yes stop_codon:yes gene_type:complete
MKDLSKRFYRPGYREGPRNKPCVFCGHYPTLDKCEKCGETQPFSEKQYDYVTLIGVGLGIVALIVYLIYTWNK